ncbi:MAG: type IV secretory system conjugative DNA transfer family protein [Bdellovibrionales bacterium]
MQHLKNKYIAFLLLVLCASPLSAHAQLYDDESASPPPPDYMTVLNVPKIDDEEDEQNIIEKEKQNSLDIRADALEEAALSYGARGGLAYRTFEIQRRLAEQESHLTRIYDFRRLLIPSANGLLIEPPVVSEAQQALLIKGGGQEAATADRVLKINRQAKIVSAPRDWRTYLERDWGVVDPPPGLLRPRTKRERKSWEQGIKFGWQAGVEQADEIFQADLDRLTNDLVGMVRYRELLAQGMITPPYALAENRGITGDGNELRIGDRGLEITGPSQFVTESDRWQPTPR